MAELKDNMAAIEDLVASGDIKLSEERAKFFGKAGRSTTLTDTQLIEAIAMTTDDDDFLLAENIIKLEERYK